MNIILIGMPGAGKSTIGPALAGRLGLEFIDTDTLLKRKTGRELRAIVAEDGYEVFLKLQEELIVSMKPVGNIIATGGSVVCSEPAMLHMKRDGRIIYLKMDLKDIEKRLLPERRLARSKDRSLDQVYNERCPLYEKYADLIVDCSDKSVDAIVTEILAFFKY
ncbi:MAG: shikimate kinase [Ruminiclostridium sp.]|nr:shikimate kinase [Ruminiclostridium sp.]